MRIIFSRDRPAQIDLLIQSIVLAIALGFAAGAMWIAEHLS